MALYAIAFSFAGLTPLVLLPVLTQALSPAEFGQATSWIVLVAMIANTCGLTVHGLVSVRFFKDAFVGFQRIVAAAISVILLVHLLAGLVISTGLVPLSAFTGLTRTYSLGAAAVGVALSINLIGLAFMQASQRPGIYLLLRMLQSAIEILGCLALLQLIVAGPDVRIWSYVAAIAASALCALAFLVKKRVLATAPDKKAFESVARFGIPLVPHVFAGQMLTNLDRIMVSYLLGIEKLGIFMVASQLGMALSLVIEPLNRTLAPWLFKKLTDGSEDDKRLIVKVTYGLFVGLLALSMIAAALFVSVFDLLFSDEFSDAKQIIVPVAVGMAFQGMYYGVVNYIFYAEKTGKLSFVTCGVVAAAVVWSALLIMQFGILGAGLSFMITNIVLFVAVWVLSNAVMPMPWFSAWRTDA
ncbi:oligosaccharide flippase family protein [Parerythrobacter jejuensis]